MRYLHQWRSVLRIEILVILIKYIYIHIWFLVRCVASFLLYPDEDLYYESKYWFFLSNIFIYIFGFSFVAWRCFFLDFITGISSERRVFYILCSKFQSTIYITVFVDIVLSSFYFDVYNSMILWIQAHRHCSIRILQNDFILLIVNWLIFDLDKPWGKPMTVNILSSWSLLYGVMVLISSCRQWKIGSDVRSSAKMHPMAHISAKK